MTRPPRYVIGYAPTELFCKKCLKKIVVEQLVIIKFVFNSRSFNVSSPIEEKHIFHPVCLMVSLESCLLSSTVVTCREDLEGFDALKRLDQEFMWDLIQDLREKREYLIEQQIEKVKRCHAVMNQRLDSEAVTSLAEFTVAAETREKELLQAETDAGIISVDCGEPYEYSKHNLFSKFCALCETISSRCTAREKRNVISLFLESHNEIDSPMYVRFLVCQCDGRMYNMTPKTIMTHFSLIFGFDRNELENVFNICGDVSMTIRRAMEEHDLGKTNAINWGVQKIDRWLFKMSELSDFNEQNSHLEFAFSRMAPIEVMYLIRLMLKELKLNLNLESTLRGFHPNAYELFVHCRSLEDVFERHATGELDRLTFFFEETVIGVPFLPMLALTSTSIADAMLKCPNGMHAEIMYGGKRLQIHKKGDTYTYFNNSMKILDKDWVILFEEFIPDAIRDGTDLIFDGELAMLDTKTFKPIPLSECDIKNVRETEDLVVCLFIFDLLRFNDINLSSKPLKERRLFLEDVMIEIPNRIHFATYHHIMNGDNDKLQTVIWKAINGSVDGIILKDVGGVYEPGERQWLKMKSEEVDEGKMIESAYLIVLGCYFGIGEFEGMMSTFLMGVYDEITETYRTVTKCALGNSMDDLYGINEYLINRVARIDRKREKMPKWLKCSYTLVPDFVMIDPTEALVWEIDGAQFSKCSDHTADGITIRFSRVKRHLHNKDWESATTLMELKCLYRISRRKSEIDHSALEDEKQIYHRDLDVGWKTRSRKETLNCWSSSSIEPSTGKAEIVPATKKGHVNGRSSGNAPSVASNRRPNHSDNKMVVKKQKIWKR